MSWLLLSMVCSTLIFIIFKLFARFKINNLQAIIMNYFVAYIIGFLTADNWIKPMELPSYKWFPSVLILGLLFIILFQVMALVSQKIGVSVVSVAVKMSLVIPVSFGLIYYNEHFGPLKVLGVLAALLAVYLATRKKEKININPTMAWLPVLLFIGSGFLDAFLKFNQEELVATEEHSSFTSSLFGMAAIFGLIFVAIDVVKGKFSFHWRNIIGGIALGIPNYGSIYFLLKALDQEGLQSSVVFPINNVGIVLLSALVGAFVFREKLTTKNIIGILLAILAIILIAFENYH